MRLGTRLLPLVIVLPLLLAGCPKPATPPDAQPAAAQPAGEPIVLGAIFSITGPGAPLGAPEQAAAQMVAKQINDAGGINGRPLKVIIEDDATEEAKAVLAAKKLIEQDKVMAIVGPTMSGTSLAIVDACTKAGVPLISCAASVKITNPVADRKWVFSTAQTDVLAVQKLVEHLKAQKLDKVAIICDSNAFGQSGAEQLKEQLPAAGITIVDEEKFSTKDTSMTAQLTKIKSKQPAAIICWGTNPGPAVVAKNARSLGLKTPLIMSHGIANAKFIELAGDAAEGVILPAGALLTADQLSADHPQKIVLQKFVGDFQSLANAPANSFAGYAHDALQLIIDSIRSGAADRATLRDAIEKTTGYAGVSGVFDLSASDHNGLTKEAFILATIKDGKWTMVK
ncbi:MAG: ABC transporter substrate-binding protein [Armatimonadota bacterium]